MKIIHTLIVSISSFFICLLLMTGCDQGEEKAKPQVADINSVGCLVANDFYAVHFSAYLQPSADVKANTPKEREALLKPYCEQLPSIGKAFFSADLIDRDVRKTPIGVRVVEVEPLADKKAKPSEAKEIRTLLDVPPKLYPRGVVEAQATLDKVGDYALILIIGGDEAISEDDRLHIPFHVGKTTLNLSTQMLFLLSVGLLVLIGAVYFMFRMRRS